MAKDPTFGDCFTLGNLMAASRECERGVRWKGQTQRFCARRLTNCERLLGEIEAGSYKPHPVENFEICERGKRRTVKPVTFRDRVAQRCLCDHALIPALEGYVLPGCSAVLPGRGLDYASRMVRNGLAGAGPGSWVVRWDYHDYFATIGHDRLMVTLCKLLKDERLMRFAESVIDADSPGLDLGSHVSQLCATAYPTPVDRAVLNMPGVSFLHRYMDDGLAVCNSRKSALAAMGVVRAESERMGLVLNEGKCHVTPVCQPFVYLKLRYAKLSDGTVRVNVRKPQSRRAVRHARSVVRLSRRDPDVDPVPCLASLSGYLGRGDADLTHLVDRATAR